MAADRSPLPRGEDAVACAQPAGVMRPVIDVRRCEGKAACVAVCPYGVFALGTLDDATLARQPWYIRLKLRLHGRRTALTPHVDACRACGKCVSACPEQAIHLEPVPPTHTPSR